MGNRHWNLQLTDRYTGFSIITAGGTCQVCTAGTPDKATLFNAAGASLANPITPVRGMIDFYVVDTVLTVDLYVMSAGGQFVVMYGVSSSGPGEIYVDTSDKLQWAIIPFSIADAVANTEKDTGFDLPAKAWVLDRLHGLGISVFAIDAGQNILFGLLSTETNGDADGFSTNVSLATSTTMKIAVNGALFSTNAPYATDAGVAKSISYTLDTSTDTGKGFILIPYRNVT